MNAIIVLAGAIACNRHTRSRTSAIASAPAEAVAPSEVASTEPPPRASDAASNEPEWVQEIQARRRAFCDPALLLPLQAAIAHLYETPPGSQIESVDHPIAYAYTALLRMKRGDTPGSEQAVDRLPGDVTDSATPSSSSGGSRAARLLSLIFRAQLSYGGDPCPLPAGKGAETWCGIFDAYPKETLQAFAPQGGSVVDGYSGEQKEYCAERLVRDFVSPELASAFSVALAKITGALYDVAPRPLGTAYSSVLYEVDDLVQEPIFGLSGVARGDPRRLHQAVVAAGRFIRDLDTRLARFRQMEALVVPDLGNAYCRMAEHHGRRNQPEACRADATARLEGALQTWLEARPYSSLQMNTNGEIYEPRPWR